MRNTVSRLALRCKDRLALGSEPRCTDVAAQLALSMSYRANPNDAPARPLSEYGFSCYSQADEDGILLYLFSMVGATNRQCVEICAGDGIECNTANLILNRGWHGLLIDGDADNVARGTRFYARSRHTRIYPPKIVQAWITSDGVNDVIAENGFSGEIDLLSLDLDGVDYWIWKAIAVISPRIVVLEYQDILGPERSWTVPYSDDFVSGRYSMTDYMPNFAGASLRAFVKLGQSKGYRLVGINRYGFNAFFVRNDIGLDLLPEIDVQECFTHPKVLEGMRDRFPLVAKMPWVEV
jgi:hypothetical protein